MRQLGELHDLDGSPELAEAWTRRADAAEEAAAGEACIGAHRQ